MRYIAVFDIPDDYGYGCPIVKACPNDGEQETIFASQIVKMDDFQKPKTIEADFYRRNTLDHMEAAGYAKATTDRLKDPEKVWKETVRINTAKGTSGAYQRSALYVGQFYLLDTIKKMQETYIGLS